GRRYARRQDGVAGALKEIVEAEEMREARAGAIRRIGRLVGNDETIAAGRRQRQHAVGEIRAAVSTHRAVERGSEAANGAADGARGPAVDRKCSGAEIDGDFVQEIAA